MTTASKVLADAMSLPEPERLELAAELIASVDGPADADWDKAWAEELHRRMESARNRGEPAPKWSDVRSRVLARLAAK